MKYLFAALLVCAVGAPVQAEGPVQFLGRKVVEAVNARVEMLKLAVTGPDAAELAVVKAELATALTELENAQAGFAAVEMQRREKLSEIAELIASLEDAQEEINALDDALAIAKARSAENASTANEWALKAQQAIAEKTHLQTELIDLRGENIKLQTDNARMQKNLNLLWKVPWASPRDVFNEVKGNDPSEWWFSYIWDKGGQDTIHVSNANPVNFCKRFWFE